MSEHQPRRALTVLAGFLSLSDTTPRFAERLRCSRQKAEYRVAREIAEGKLPLVEAETLELRAAAEGDRLDFATSEVVPATGGPTYLSIGHNGGMTMRRSSGAVPVVVDIDDLERLLDQLAPVAAANGSPPRYQSPGEPVHQASAKTPRPPGRPASYDWPWYEVQLRRRVHQHGLPEKSSILVAEVMALFCRKIADPPEQRTIERFIATLWPSLEDLVGSCEITPVSTTRRN